MEGSAVDYCVLEEIVEKVGVQEFRKMAEEVAPAKFQPRVYLGHGMFAATVVFWLSISPSVFVVDIAYEVVYPMAVANLVAVKRMLL